MTKVHMETKLFTLFGALLVVGALASTAVNPAYADNALSASPGVIPLGGTTTLTQTLDVSATVLGITVLEADGDTCVAPGGPVGPGPGISWTYPTDFSIAISGGDGACDTMDVGVYTAETQVSGVIPGTTIAYTIEFETNFFVIPESPIGVAALMGSSLAALGGYLGLRRLKTKI